MVAGGEISGAVVSALGVEMLRIGGRIDPGRAVDGNGRRRAEPLALALKSGNFGSRRLLREGVAFAGYVMRWH